MTTTATAERTGAARALSGAAVSGASLAVFRVAFGTMVAVSTVRFVANGWVATLYLDPEMHFHYPGLWWVRPLPAPAMYGLHVLMAIAAVALALGWRTRSAAVLFTLAFAYCEAIDVATYLNHYELVTLLGVLCVFLPVSQCWSLDARRRPPCDPVVPAWTVWFVRGQLGVVYVFAGLGKLNADWLMRGEPLDTWLADRGLPSSPGLAVTLSWAGALFDLLVVPALCWRRTRPFAYSALVTFHLVTAALFPPIGVFPFLMIALTPVFFEPDWPVRLARRQRTLAAAPTVARSSRWALFAAGVWMAVQVAVPLRHLAIPGDVRWTEEGYRWSWRVLLTEKAGDARFTVTDPATGASRTVWPSEHLAPFQVRAMSTRPELIRQFAAHLSEVEAAETGTRPAVRADVWVTVNGRRRARLVDPSVDLAAAAERPWILDDPFDQPGRQ